MSAPNELYGLTWATDRLPEAIEQLIHRAHLIDGAGASGELRSTPPPVEPLGDWIEQAARRAGCEAHPLNTTLGSLPGDLANAFPALLRVRENSYLLVLRANRRRLTVLTPVLERRNVSLAGVCRLLCEPAEAEHRSTFEALLSDAEVPKSRRAKAMKVLLTQKLSGKAFHFCWVLRSHPGGRPFRLLKQAGAIGNAGGMVALHTVQYLLWLISWGILGNASFTGRMDRAWILAWALLLITLVPCQVFTTWLQGLFAVGLGTFLKRRLLCGALKLRPDEMRHGGIGSYLGQALEAEAVETLALSGGIAGLLATVEIVLAMCVLGRFALALAAWSGLTIYAAWRFLRSFENWTETRMTMTEDLVESMVGHRTRLAQLKPVDWHGGEDHALHEYLRVSKSLDGVGTWLIAAIPRGWLLLGLCCVAPSLAAGGTASAQTALTLGGVLLAYTALRKLTASFADIAAAVVACKKIAPLFRAAARTELLGEVLNFDQHAASHAGSGKVLEADRLSFRYRTAGRAALQSGSLTIRDGDRILLEGPSGGGKTTFASLLAGVRQPEAGLVLAGGLDRQTLGDERWRRRIASVPQFHENHILTETLAFNLLLGRSWPPTPAEMEEAETICRELGLGELLDAMPSGLMQMVGEGGWQLSHGERSRVFIARALLQSPELVILDESFAALDPENAKLALETTIGRAKTLMVIAHP